MNRKQKRSLAISVMVFVPLVFISWVYVMINGTPWGTATGQRQLISSLKREYPNLQFHVYLPASYDFKSNSYDIGIIFSKRPQYQYLFELNRKTHDAFFFGVNSPNAPVPQPENPNWLDAKK